MPCRVFALMLYSNYFNGDIIDCSSDTIIPSRVWLRGLERYLQRVYAVYYNEIL